MAQLFDTVIAARCQSARNIMRQAQKRLMVQAGLLTSGIALMAASWLGGLPGFLVFAGVLVAIGSILWWFLGTPKGSRTFHAEWCRTEIPWLQLQSLLIDLPEDWVVFQHGGIPVVAGPPGAVVLAPAAAIPGESDSDIKEAIQAPLVWADTICRSARLPGEPVGLLISDNLRRVPEAGRIRTVTLSRLSMYLFEMPRVWSPSDIRAFTGSAVGPPSMPQALRNEHPTRAAGTRAKGAFGRRIRRLAITFAVFVVGAVLVAGIQLAWPAAIARLVYSGQSILSSFLPQEWLGPLRIPIIEEMGDATIVGTVVRTCDLVERVGGGRPSGRVSGGENVVILDQAFADDSQKAAWVYVRASAIEGWALQSRIAVAYLPAGTRFFDEADERLGIARVIGVDTPAVLTRRSDISGKAGSTWWEFWAPGARRGWIKSTINPLAGVSLEGKP